MSSLFCSRTDFWPWDDGIWSQIKPVWEGTDSVSSWDCPTWFPHDVPLSIHMSSDLILYHMAPQFLDFSLMQHFFRGPFCPSLHLFMLLYSLQVWLQMSWEIQKGTRQQSVCLVWARQRKAWLTSSHFQELCCCHKGYEEQDSAVKTPAAEMCFDFICMICIFNICFVVF